MANTLNGVNLAQIAQESLPYLSTVFAPLSGLVTDFSPDILTNGDSVTTRYATRPTAKDLSTGFATTDDVSTASKTITLSNYFGNVIAFKDTERSKSAVDLVNLFVAPSIDAIGIKVFGDIWNLVTAANFPTNFVSTAANFDRGDFADIAATLTTTKKAPKFRRAALINPTYYASIVKSLISADVPGLTPEKTEHIAPRTSGFNVYESDIADDNSENLQGFCFHPSSLLIASRGVDFGSFAEEGGQVENVVIPGLGLPVQFRMWYSKDNGEQRMSIGVYYGVAKGQDFGVRITSV